MKSNIGRWYPNRYSNTRFMNGMDEYTDGRDDDYNSTFISLNGLLSLDGVYNWRYSAGFKQYSYREASELLCDLIVEFTDYGNPFAEKYGVIGQFSRWEGINLPIFGESK